MMATRGSRFTSRPPIFGREEIREEAERLLTRTLGGAGGGLLLTGPGGVGKTQILNGLIELATKKGCTVLSGRALPEELPPAFSLLRALLASERMPGAPTSPPAWALARAALSFAPAVSPPEVPETVRLSDDLEETLAPTGVTQPEGLGTSREELFARLERHLLERAQKCPLLIAIDDLHFADSSTLEFLSQFVSQLSTTRIAFAATHAESTEIPERTREAIETLSGVPGILTIPVRGLNIAEMEEFVRWIHGGRAPNQDDVRRWLAQTDGNPLFVEQLVRVATGYFTPTNDRDCAVHGVTEMLLDRVKTLGDRERRVLTYAVVLGKEFQFTNL